MSEEHNQWQYWLCSACVEPKRFDIEQLYVAHLQEEHANDISTDQIEAVVSMSACNAPVHLEQVSKHELVALIRKGKLNAISVLCAPKAQQTILKSILKQC